MQFQARIVERKHSNTGMEGIWKDEKFGIAVLKKKNQFQMKRLSNWKCGCEDVRKNKVK